MFFFTKFFDGLCVYFRFCQWRSEQRVKKLEKYQISFFFFNIFLKGVCWPGVRDEGGELGRCFLGRI